MTEVAALRHWRANCRHEASSRPRPRRGLLMVTLMIVMLGRYEGRFILPTSQWALVLSLLGTAALQETQCSPPGGQPRTAPQPRPLCHTDWPCAPAPCVTLTGTGPPPPVSQLSHSGHRILEINGSRHPHTGQQQHHQSPPAKGWAELSNVNMYHAM